MANNEYTINILNADQLYVEGKRIQQLDLGTLVEKAEGIGIGINNSFPKESARLAAASEKMYIWVYNTPIELFCLNCRYHNFL